MSMVRHLVKPTMSLQDLHDVAGIIEKHYKNEGFLVAQVYVPQQEIKDGIIEVKILEGRYGRVIIRNATEISERLIQSWMGDLKTGELVQKSILEKTVLLLNELAGLDVKASLQSGEHAGTVDIDMEIADKPAPPIDVAWDNGSPAVLGKGRLGSGITWNNPFNRGDRFGLRVQTTGEGLSYARITYDSPLGGSIWRSSTFVSGYGYKLVNVEGAAKDSTGQGYSVGTNVQYPLMKDPTQSLWIGGGYENRKLISSNAPTPPDRTINVGQLILRGDKQDPSWGGINLFQWTLSRGRINTAPEKVEPSYTKSQLIWGRIQTLGTKTSLRILGNSQRANSNLDSSEKMNLDGPSGVRGYLVGSLGTSGSADQGDLINIELHQSLGTVQENNISVITFSDWGRALLERKPKTSEQYVYPKGYGIAVGITHEDRGSIKLSWAHKRGEMPPTGAPPTPYSPVWLLQTTILLGQKE